MKTFISSYLKELDKLLEQQRSQHEQLVKWFKPQLRLKEQMDKFVGPQQRIQADLVKSIESLKRHQHEKLFKWYEQQFRQIDRWIEPQERLHADLANSIKSLKRQHEQLFKWYEPHLRLKEQIEKWLGPQQRMQEQLVKWLRSQQGQQEAVTKWGNFLKIEKNFNEILDETNPDNIRVDSSGMISVEGEVFSANDFVYYYNNIINSLEIINSPANALKFIWVSLQKISKPIAKLVLIILLNYIIGITVNLTTPYFQNIFNESSDKDKREKIKEIKLEAQQYTDLKRLTEYRFISVTILNVRAKPSCKSEIIDKLYFGQIVRIQKKGRRWSRIEYNNDDTELIIEGWVFSRYLVKFKK